MQERKKAISQALSIAIVIVVIVAAFGGYAISLATQKGGATQPTTFMSTVTKTETSTTTISGHASLGTVSEQIVVEYLQYHTIYVFGNCTVAAGTIASETPTTTVTSYIFPSDTSGTLNLTIVTTTTQSYRMTEVTVNSSVPPETVIIMNGTVSITSIETCPVYS